MNGHKLVEILSKLTKEELDLEIATEGCDCSGDVGEVSIDDGYDPPRIYLART